MRRAALRFSPKRPDDDRHRERARELAATGDPERYIFEIFGWSLARDQQRLVQAYMDHRQFLAVGANATGKSIGLAMLFVGWGFDAQGSILDDGGIPRGSPLLIVAPTQAAGLEAYTKHFIGLGERARDRGHLLPGWANHHPGSVNWVAAPGRWYMRQITAPPTSEPVSRSALGPHHDQMQIWVEEVDGVHPGLISAAEGRLRSRHNKLGCSTNPHSSSGLGHHLSKKWPTVYSSVVGWLSGEIKAHENIEQRKLVIPGAVDHEVVEDDLRTPGLFANRGILWTGAGEAPEGQAAPKGEAGDFIYALPPKGMVDKPGPRLDGYPGHPDCALQVLRPLNGAAYGRIVGGFPPIDPMSLFSQFMLSQAVALRAKLPDPVGPPDVVGIDASWAENGDEMIAVPWWGLPPNELLELAWSSRKHEGESIQDGANHLLGQGLPGVPAIVGEPVPLSTEERGAKAARQVKERWGLVRCQVDDGAGSAVSSSLSALGFDVAPMYFGGCRPEDMKPLPGQLRMPLNNRTKWAFDLADVLSLGLVAFCADPMAHEDLLALGAPILKSKAAARTIGGGSIDVYGLKPKIEVKKEIGGRSPDRGDGILAASGSAPWVPSWPDD